MTIDVTKPEAQFLIAIGVVGGLFFGYQAATHMFVEGLTAKERKNLLVFSASGLGMWAVSELYDLEKLWVEVEQAAVKAVGP